MSHEKKGLNSIQIKMQALNEAMSSVVFFKPLSIMNLSKQHFKV